MQPFLRPKHRKIKVVCSSNESQDLNQGLDSCSFSLIYPVYTHTPTSTPTPPHSHMRKVNKETVREGKKGGRYALQKQKYNSCPSFTINLSAGMKVQSLPLLFH